MILTLFDLDNTLLRGDSDYEWGQYLIQVGAVEREGYERANKAYYEDYKAGRLDIHDFLAFALKPLSEYPKAQLLEWRAAFVEDRIRPLITDEAIELVRIEKERADRIAIVTATNSFVTSPIAELFEIDHLIATEPERDAVGNFTGRVLGTPCFREGKITRVNDWLHQEGLSFDALSHSRFYSDSQNDLPLMEVVKEAVAVNPDPTLEAHATRLGWPILRLKPAEGGRL